MDSQQRQRLTQLFERAAHSDNGNDRIALYRALDGVELFYVADELVIEGREMLHTPRRTLPDGSTAMVVYSSKNHPDLPPSFAGAMWRQVLRVANEAVRPDWLVVVNKDNGTVSIQREQIPMILADLEGREPDDVMMQPPDELETTITSAVEAPSAEWLESALQQLRGRELYLHLASGAEPAMRTSAAAGREGWILTYTTRRRPGIQYGGIRWEELVKIIKGSDGTPGVRVVNDADDWILLDRDLI